VVFGIYHPGHGIDKRYGFIKPLEFKTAGDELAVIAQAPAFYLLDQGFRLLTVHGVDAAFAGFAMALAQVAEGGHFVTPVGKFISGFILFTAISGSTGNLMHFAFVDPGSRAARCPG